MRPIPVSLSSCFISHRGAPLSTRNSCSCRSLCTLGLRLFGGRLLRLFTNRRIRLPHCGFRANHDRVDNGHVHVRPGSILIIRNVRTLGPRLATRMSRRLGCHICTSTLAAVLLSRRGCVPAASGQLLHHVIHSFGCHNYSTHSAVHH